MRHSARSSWALSLLLCIVQMVAAAAAEPQPPPPPPPFTPPTAAAAVGVVTTDITVSTEAQLLFALGTPSIAVIRMAADIVVRADSVILGADPASGVFRLTRNVTVTAPPSVDWFPQLNVADVT